MSHPAYGGPVSPEHAPCTCGARFTTRAEPAPSDRPAPERAATSWALAPGAAVEVRSRYLGTWTSGFELADHVDEGYRIRRRSDASLLPGVFAFVDVRRPQLGLPGWPAGARSIWS